MLPPSPPDDMDVDLARNPELGGNARSGNKREFGSDSEILARAFCSEKGWNALISRRGRGCLACAVREAGALGWGVVLRV